MPQTNLTIDIKLTMTTVMIYIPNPKMLLKLALARTKNIMEHEADIGNEYHIQLLIIT